MKLARTLFLVFVGSINKEVFGKTVCHVATNVDNTNGSE